MSNETDKKMVQMPVNKMTYSMLTQLLRNPLIFKLKHILGVYTGKTGMSGMIGRASHEALKVYYGAHPDISTSADPAEARREAIEYGMKYLTDTADVYIRFGRSGSREKMLAGFSKAMRFYFEEEPEYDDILMVEEKLEGEIKTIDGDLLPLPGVAIPDMVDKKKDGTIEIIDTKFVKSFTRYENEDGEPHEDYIKIVQAQFLWHLLRASKDLTATKVIFREVKMTENKEAGDPQIRDYIIPCDHQPYRDIFYNLYKDVVKFISNPEAIYLPNLSDPFDGEQAGLLYAQGLLTSDMSDVEVMHRVKEVAFTSKKFVSSKIDRIENKYLTPDEKIKLRLAEFGIPVEPVETKDGTAVTQYRFKVSAGIRMTVFQKHKADIARAIEAKGDIRILAPIPGTSLVGIEVPKENKENVMLGKEHLVMNTLSIPIGVEVDGTVVKIPLDKMPHLLIAGTTGSGKSVLLHSTLTSLIKQNSAQKMQLVLIDPKRVELVAFKKAKHLKGGKILYEYPEILLMLMSLKDEMESRYKLLESKECRDIKDYNAVDTEITINEYKERTQKARVPMSYIVVVIDEFADLIFQGKMAEKKKKNRTSLKNLVTRVQVEQMARQAAKMGMTFHVPKDDGEDDYSAEELIAKLAAMARAVGIHLIIATQNPRVDVITGLIKANFPTRIALTTASATDSKVILGIEGAERLAGQGEMLLMSPGSELKRLQGFLTK